MNWRSVNQLSYALSWSNWSVYRFAVANWPTSTISFKPSFIGISTVNKSPVCLWRLLTLFQLGHQMCTLLLFPHTNSSCYLTSIIFNICYSFSPIKHLWTSGLLYLDQSNAFQMPTYRCQCVISNVCSSCRLDSIEKLANVLDNHTVVRMDKLRR